VKVFTEIEELMGKKTYKDIRLNKLQERFKSKKLTFISIEFTNQNPTLCECLLIKEENLISYIIQDLEKIDRLWEKTSLKELLSEIKDLLEKEKPIFGNLSFSKISQIKEYAFLTARPLVIFNNEDTLALLKKILEVCGYISFFTVNSNEIKGWLLKRGRNIIEAAGKIHTDLAKGFIRAEVYNIKDLDSFDNPSSAKARGVMKIVDRDYIVEEGDIINIKFKV